ncbi:Transposase (plasmid) [Phaeobacter inhibens]|uniref:transposase n=1 Tax=Rhodobacterales TaxID=204455 RepID=UPI000C9B4A80|nr:MULTISPECIES: transposase [Rhodobacterales]AUQ60752.1 Transposase [Phaeobacter inhibens]MDF1856992.1 IS1182 family transposase [Pseudooceanicola sp.]
MMGRLETQENLFYRFRVDDHVPRDHLLRRIDWLLDFDTIRHELAALYSHTGRPSVDPELMLRMLLIGYLYGIRSERRLVEDVHLNLAYRWFCKLGLEGRVPDRSTFSKNRHGRFAEGDVLRHLFESVVEKCVGFGLVGGTDAAVDGSTIEADANKMRKGTPQEIEKLWSRKEQVQRPVAEYLAKMAEAAPPSEPGPTHKSPKYLSETDPDAAWSVKDGPGRFSYETNYLVDTDNGIIVDVEATPARLSQEIVAAKAMLARSRQRHDFQPDRLAADGSYGTGPFLAWLMKREVTPHVPVLDRQHQSKGKYDLSHFRYDAERDSYTCLEGHEMPLRRIRQDVRMKVYRTDKDTCGACPIKKACTDAPYRTVTRHLDEKVRQSVRDMRHSWQYDESRRRRKKVEMLFAHLKRHLGIRRLRLRGLSGANEEFLLAATAQNLKRLAKMVPC